MAHDFDPATGAYAKPGKPDRKQELRPASEPSDDGHDFDPRTGKYQSPAGAKAKQAAKDGA